MTSTLGVIIGRFQTDNLSEGHMALFDHVGALHKRIVVLVGVRDTPANRTHPLDFKTRERMLSSFISSSSERYTIMPIMDHISDMEWSKAVDEVINSVWPGSNAILYGGRDSFIPKYHGTHETEQISPQKSETSSKRRRELGRAPQSSPNFRAGVIYSMENLRPRMYMAVDIAMIKQENGDNMVLMGKKQGEDAWRFPGGFADFKDGSLENAAKRELAEETGMSCEANLKYIGSFAINDWRDTEDARMMTTFYAVPYSFGAPRAGDDLAQVEWRPLHAGYEANIVESHKPLWEALLKEAK